MFLEAYDSDPSWAAQGKALPQPPRLAGGRLVVELTSLKEAPKACENFRCCRSWAARQGAGRLPWRRWAARPPPSPSTCSTPATSARRRCLCTGEKGAGKASGKPLHYEGVRLHRIQTGAAHGRHAAPPATQQPCSAPRLPNGCTSLLQALCCKAATLSRAMGLRAIAFMAASSRMSRRRSSSSGYGRRAGRCCCVVSKGSTLVVPALRQPVPRPPTTGTMRRASWALPTQVR